MAIDISRMFDTFLATTVPLAIYIWNNRRQAKADVKAKHEENQTKLNEIINERKFLPPHIHTEAQGTLTVEGIHPPRE